MTIKEFFKNDIFATNAGIEIESAGKGYATAVMRIEPEHLNAGGTTQGGAIFTLADLALAAAANSNGKLSFSISSNIQFFKGSYVGDTLRAEAKELFLHKRISVYRAEVRNQNNELLATCEANFYRKDNDVPFQV